MLMWSRDGVEGRSRKADSRKMHCSKVVFTGIAEVGIWGFCALFYKAE